jgi:hypothetical protein
MQRHDNLYIRLGLAFGRLVAETDRRRRSLGLRPLGEWNHASGLDGSMKACLGDWVWLAAISADRTAEEAAAIEARYLASLNV